MGILDGIRVLDWTGWQQGPVATMMLASLGADVIKLEQPGVGDPARGLRTALGVDMALPHGRNAYFEINNRNKRSIALDVTKPEGRQLICRLIPHVDVIVQNVRSEVVHRLGMDYESLVQHNPKLVYVALTGFGAEGPDKAKPAYDVLALARAGVFFCAGEPDAPPQSIVGGLADQSGAIMAAYSVLGGLLARERLGIGQLIDCSLLGSTMWLISETINFKFIAGKALQRQSRLRPNNPLYNQYECADGKWIMLAFLQSQRHWGLFCRTVGLDELEHDERFAKEQARTDNNAALVAILDRLFASKVRSDWALILGREPALLWDVVNQVDDLAEDEQCLANGYVRPYDHPLLGHMNVVGSPVNFHETPAVVEGIAPEIGEHTEEVLADLLGLDWNELVALRDAEII